MRDEKQAQDPVAAFDPGALEALYAAISGSDGVEVGALLAQLEDLFARPRSDADLQAYREGKKPWKRLRGQLSGGSS